MNGRIAIRATFVFAVVLMLLSVTSSFIAPRAAVHATNYVVGGVVMPTPIASALESVMWILVAGTISAAMIMMARKRK